MFLDRAIASEKTVRVEDRLFHSTRPLGIESARLPSRSNSHYASHGEQSPLLLERWLREDDLHRLPIDGMAKKQLSFGQTGQVASDIGVKETGVGLLIEICRHFGASTYLAQKSAGRYLDEKVFQKAGIQLEFFNPPAPVYPQLWGDFIPNLSTFDLLLNCGPKASDIVLDR